MMNNDFLQELSERLARLVPAAEELRADARTKIEQTLKQALSDLDVLTTEEFEAQSRALQRAEQRVEELESLVKDLEGRLTDLESRL